MDDTMIRLYGLIGKTLKHSFSQKYFRSKFEKESISNCDYELFELEDISQFPGLIKRYENLRGLNVTIPYKQVVMPYLVDVEGKAKEIGAVNTIKILNKERLIGHNTDYWGFKLSLEKWAAPSLSHISALVLGTGGASKAIEVVLKDLGIPYQRVSRTAQEGAINYQDLAGDPSLVPSHQLIINTTPLGTSPNVDEAPAIPYDQITSQHYLYDLVYNPAETLFLKKGKERGAQIKNGLEMLEIQAEKAWEIWNS